MYDFSDARLSHAPLMKSRRFGISFSLVVCHRFGLYSADSTSISTPLIRWPLVAHDGLAHDAAVRADFEDLLDAPGGVADDLFSDGWGAGPDLVRRAGPFVRRRLDDVLQLLERVGQALIARLVADGVVGA